MVRRRLLAKSGSNSPNCRLASPLRWTSTEASVFTRAFFPSRTTASWIVVVRVAFRSDFGPNDPTGGTQREAEQYGRPLRELNAMETLKHVLLALAVVCAGSSVVIADEIKAGDLVITQAWSRPTPKG